MPTEVWGLLLGLAIMASEINLKIGCHFKSQREQHAYFSNYLKWNAVKYIKGEQEESALSQSLWSWWLEVNLENTGALLIMHSSGLTRQ